MDKGDKLIEQWAMLVQETRTPALGKQCLWRIEPADEPMQWTMLWWLLGVAAGFALAMLVIA